jgi:hypothetical protein
VFNNDYFMREMEKLSSFLAHVMFEKDVARLEITDEQGNVLESNLFFHELIRMVRDGKINEAENYLFNQVEKYPTPEYLQVAIDFYSELEKLSDEYLKTCLFGRDEIMDGLLGIKKIYKVSE